MPGPARKRAYDETQTPVEKHDSVFLSPLVLFKKPAYNHTFQDFTITKVPAIPADERLAQTYTFHYNGQQYGLLKMNETKLEADVQIVDTAANPLAGYAADRNVGIIPFLLRTMWKSKEVHVNHQLVNSLTGADHIVTWLRHITGETKKSWFPSRKLNIGMHDTAGYWDHVAFQNTAVPHSTVAGWQAQKNICRNLGLRERSRLFNNGAERRMIDDLDTVCFNENGSDKYFPTDFDIRVVLHRNPPNKYIRGPIGPSGANANDTGVNTANVSLRNFSMVLSMFKPNDQLTQAINKSMVGNNEECIFYTSHYRIVPLAVPAQQQQIVFQDIFNGARPTRAFFNLMTQQRWNGGFGTVGVADDYDGTNEATATAHFNTLATNNGNHPLRAICPNFTYVALRINQQIVHPEYRNQMEAYNEWRRMLNRQYEEMPFDYDEFLTDYGWLCFDLSENKDSFNEVLPNSTSGNVAITINLSNPLDNVAHQLICVAEFRNEVKIGYNTPARKMLDY